MQFTFGKPKSILGAVTGGLIPGLSEKPKAPKLPSADRAQADVDKAADEAARKLRAREKLRQGAAASMTSGGSAGAFASTASSKPSLLG